MGVCTVVIKKVHVIGDRKMVVADVTPSASYATGGETLSGTELKLELTVTSMSVPGMNFAGTRLCAWDPATTKLKIFSALGTEVTAATDQSGSTLRVVAVGKGSAAE